MGKQYEVYVQKGQPFYKILTNILFSHVGLLFLVLAYAFGGKKIIANNWKEKYHFRCGCLSKAWGGKRTWKYVSQGESYWSKILDTHGIEIKSLYYKRITATLCNISTGIILNIPSPNCQFHGTFYKWKWQWLCLLQ